MVDIMDKTKKLTEEIRSLIQDEQVIRERIKSLKSLVEEKKNRQENLKKLQAEEAELLKLLEGL